MRQRHYDTRCGNLHDGLEHVQLASDIMYEAAKDKRTAGFLYAGKTSDGLLKVGLATTQCPICRVHQQGLEPLGLRFSERARVDEQQMLHVLGSPVRGLETYDQADSRWEWLLANHWLLDIWRTELDLAMEWAKLRGKDTANPPR